MTFTLYDLLPFIVLILGVLGYYALVKPRQEEQDREMRALRERIEETLKQIDDLLEDDHYTSTACWHDLHKICRLECKHCGEPCKCECHEGTR